MPHVSCLSLVLALGLAAGAAFTPAGAEDVNLAADALVACSDGTNPEYAADGQRTGWFWEAHWPAWLEVDLGRVCTLSEFQVFLWWGNDKWHYRYAVETSCDRIGWTERVNERTNAAPSTAEGRRHAIAPAAARYVRLHVFSNNVNAAAHVREFEIYGRAPGAP